MHTVFPAAAAAAFVIFVVVDFIWLSNAARWIYRPHIGKLLLDQPALMPAVVFYLLYGVGLAFLVVRPAIAAGSVVSALLMGALFGLVAYGTYDLTNQATLRVWPVEITLIDLCWGTLLTSVTAIAGYFGAMMVRG